MDCEVICLDMHVHSRHSRDSILTLHEIHKLAEKREITPIICDHNTIQGSLEYHQRNYYSHDDCPCIVAEEIRTTHGEIIGLFLNEKIPPYLSPFETLDAIHGQGGIAIIPHPGDRYRKKSAMGYETITTLLPKVKIVEVYNSRTLSQTDVTVANQYAHTHNLSVVGGSDAHCKRELFRTIVQIAPFDDPHQFIRNLQTATIHYQRSHPAYHLVSIISKRVRR